MKKILTGALTVAMVLMLASCGGSTDDASGAKVKLGTYTGLSATKNVYTVSQDAIDQTIQDDLTSIAEQKNIDGPAKNGNCMSLLFTISVDDEVIEDYSEEGYDITLGDGEYGEDFDAALTGLKSGDKFDFSIPYEESTAKVSGTVNSVYEMITPEYNKAAVKELGYDSKDEYEEAVKAQLAEQYEEESEYELLENIYSQIVENSKFSNTESALNDYFEEYVTSYTEYAQMFGMEYEQMLETFGITEDDIKAEAEQAMKKELVVKAIADKEGLEVSDDQFRQLVSEAAEAEGYEDADSYIADYGEDTIMSYLLEENTSSFLIENSEISEVEAEYPVE